MYLSLETTAVLRFLRAYIAMHGHSPSYREIQQACGFSTTSKVGIHLRVLQANGDITWQPRRLRSVQLVEKANT